MQSDTPGIYENGIFRKGDVRISDLSGKKILPIGSSVFSHVVRDCVFVDKSMLIADVIDAGPAVTLFCRPRRFGKSLNLSMLQNFFEIPSGESDGTGAASEFEGLAIWDADKGRYRNQYRAYPLVRFTFNNLKCLQWEEFEQGIRVSVSREYQRHPELAESPRLSEFEREFYAKIASATADAGQVGQSLGLLVELLQKHHGKRVVVLVDEYDAPVMAGYTNGYYREVVAFLKSWLTGALKDNGGLAFGVLTGVQRISKESIFSDLNNLVVNTSLNVASDERYGFTQAEMDALGEYLGLEKSLDEARTWYDGYRFGGIEVYNPWSALNYFRNGCVADVYWGNTSGNAVLGEMVRHADEQTMDSLYELMAPGGTLEEPLDLSVIFPDGSGSSEALWSMLYLAGYLTTNDTELPNNTRKKRALRIPNQEIAELYRSEIVERFAAVAGGAKRLDLLHRALVSGNAEAFEKELEDILLNSASYFDLTRENSYHMLMLGLLFGIPGYNDPVSNREAGRGRFDIRLDACDGDGPSIVLELKYAKPEGEGEPSPEALQALADEALAQVNEYRYAPEGSPLWGIAFSGKRCAVAYCAVAYYEVDGE